MRIVKKIFKILLVIFVLMIALNIFLYKCAKVQQHMLVNNSAYILAKEEDRKKAVKITLYNRNSKNKEDREISFTVPRGYLLNPTSRKANFVKMKTYYPELGFITPENKVEKMTHYRNGGMGASQYSITIALRYENDDGVTRKLEPQNIDFRELDSYKYNQGSVKRHLEQYQLDVKNKKPFAKQHWHFSNVTDYFTGAKEVHRFHKNTRKTKTPENGSYFFNSKAGNPVLMHINDFRRDSHDGRKYQLGYNAARLHVKYGNLKIDVWFDASTYLKDAYNLEADIYQFLKKNIKFLPNDKVGVINNEQ